MTNTKRTDLMTNRSHTRITATLALAITAGASAQPFDIPFSDDFESGTLAFDRWPIVSGVSVSTGGVNEPSPEFAMNVNAFDSATTGDINASVLATLGPVLTVSFWAQHRGVEAGESLDIQYRNTSGQYVDLIEVVSNGVDQDNFEFIQAALPIDGYGTSLRIKFNSGGNQSNDNWYIDNLRVGAFGGTNPPFTDDFEDGFDELTDWAVVFNADAPQGLDPNAPSGAGVARLNRDDFIETVPFLLGVEPNASTQQYVRYWVRADGVEPGESLRVEYLAPDPGNPGEFTYKLIEEIVATDFSPLCFRLSQFPLDMNDYTDEFRLRFTSVADEFNDFWLIDDVTIGSSEVMLDPTCVAVDIAAPCGILDLDDVDRFIVALTQGAPDADLAPPFGIFDLDDIDAFIVAFAQGCSQPYGEPNF